MRRPLLLTACLTVGSLAAAVPIARLVQHLTAHPGWSQDRRYTLPNGWRLTPAGEAIDLPGDMPGNIVAAGPNMVLVNTCGFHHQSLSLVDLAQRKVLQTVPFTKSWVGLSVSGGEAWVSGGKASQGSEIIHRVTIRGTDLRAEAGLDLGELNPKSRFVSSIVAGPLGRYVLNIQSDEVLLVNDAGSVLRKERVGYRPYGAALSPDGKTLAVTNWGDKSVMLLDASTLHQRAKVDVGPLPSVPLYSPDGRLFVSESGSNTVAEIKGERLFDRFYVGIDRTTTLGASPTAMAMSVDGNSLYIADSDNNCIAVADISGKGKPSVAGFIPTERYPSALAVTPDGRSLLIGTAKGFYGPNATVPEGAVRTKRKGGAIPYFYIGDQLAGRLSIVNIPNREELRAYTRQTLSNQPLGSAAAAPLAERRDLERNAFAKIKHVVYVIRENRTFDQVMGDLPNANGDPRLTLFGRKVTPNAHRLVETFSTLDNLYTDGEVSQVGHQWTDAAYASDYTEKQWILSYSKKGEVESDQRMTSSPGEYIWTQARKSGLKARVYGEYVSVQEDHGSLQNPQIKKDPEAYGFSAPFEKIFARGGRDTEKVEEFLSEMHDAEKSGSWPSLMVMALPEDHTRGLSAGALSPQAMVGNNDLAVGKLIEGVSHSKFWRDTAIFIIEDDAQDGPDHVDSHRTVGLVISPYVRRHVVDSTMYSTSSMLRTMELILRIPPLSEYDKKATPLYASFTSTPDFTHYDSVAPTVDLDETNPDGTELALRSSKLDFSDIDRADANELNHILWKAYRPNEPYPAPTRLLPLKAAQNLKAEKRRP